MQQTMGNLGCHANAFPVLNDVTCSVLNFEQALPSQGADDTGTVSTNWQELKTKIWQQHLKEHK